LPEKCREMAHRPYEPFTVLRRKLNKPKVKLVPRVTQSTWQEHKEAVETHEVLSAVSCAGIRVRRISADFQTIDVEMPLRFWNRNYVGTHFGGSLYSMCDPFFMVMLMENLGPDYIVWDKAATSASRSRAKA